MSSDNLSELGRKGGKAKGRANRNKRTQAKKLFEQGLNKSQIATTIGVTRRTIINWLA